MGQSTAVTTSDVKVQLIHEATEAEFNRVISQMKQDRLSELKDLGEVKKNGISSILDTHLEQDLLDSVNEIRKTRASEMELLKQLNSSNIIDKMTSSEEEKLAETVDQLRRERQQELECLSSIHSQEFKVNAHNNDEQILRIKKKREEEVEKLRKETENVDYSSLLNNMALNEEQKLAQTVEQIRRQREAEIKDMKSSAETDLTSTNNTEEKLLSLKNAREQEIDKLKKGSASDSSSFVTSLARMEEEKLAQSVDLIRKQREEEMESVKNKRLYEQQDVPMSMSDDTLAALRKNRDKELLDLKKEIVPGDVVESLAAQDQAKMNDAVGKLRKEREREMQNLKKKSKPGNLDFVSSLSEKKLYDSVSELKTKREKEIQGINNKGGKGNLDFLRAKDTEAIKSIRNQRHEEIKQISSNSDSQNKSSFSVRNFREKHESNFTKNEESQRSESNSSEAKVVKSMKCKGIPDFLKNENKKLAGSVQQLKSQREKEMNYLKKSKDVNKQELLFSTNNEDEVRKLREKREKDMSEIKTLNGVNQHDLVSSLAKKDGEKLAGSVKNIKMKREEEMKMLKGKDSFRDLLEKASGRNTSKK